MNDFITCPYNSNHKISPSKLEMHLLKSHKNEKRKLLQCKKNASIKFFKDDLQNHSEKCNYCKNYLNQNNNESTLDESLDKKIPIEKKFNCEEMNVSQIVKKKKKKKKNEHLNSNNSNEINEETINYNILNENTDNTQLY